VHRKRYVTKIRKLAASRKKYQPFYPCRNRPWNFNEREFKYHPGGWVQFGRTGTYGNLWCKCRILIWLGIKLNNLI